MQHSINYSHRAIQSMSVTYFLELCFLLCPSCTETCRFLKEEIHLHPAISNMPLLLKEAFCEVMITNIFTRIQMLPCNCYLDSIPLGATKNEHFVELLLHMQ